MQEVSYLVLSDIHMGHRVNTADKIYHNLINYFNKLKPLLHNKNNPNGIKAIFIAGDLFDRFLPSYSDEYLITNKFLVFLVKYCQEYNLILRVLEGTPLHDWGQAKMFSEIIKDLDIKVDFKYINTLEIEYLDILGLSVLYIPDEYRRKSIDTLKEVKKKLKKEKIETVDIAIMHGAFSYQIPMLSLDSTHDEDEYNKIVKYGIHIGHVHSYSQKGKIVAQGSFDRLIHGEEEPKYGTVININKNSKEPMVVTLIENKNAMIFKTVKVGDKTIKDVISLLKKELKRIPKGSALRIITKDKDKVNSALEAIDINLNRDYVIKVQLESDDKSKKDILSSVSDKENIIDTFSITKDNIIELVKSSLEENVTIENKNEIINRSIKRLEEIVNKVN